MKYKVKIILDEVEDQLFSQEFGTFVMESNITNIQKSYDRISPSEVQVVISGEEADILRFQHYSSLKYSRINE